MKNFFQLIDKGAGYWRKSGGLFQLIERCPHTSVINRLNKREITQRESKRVFFNDDCCERK